MYVKSALNFHARSIIRTRQSALNSKIILPYEPVNYLTRVRINYLEPIMLNKLDNFVVKVVHQRKKNQLKNRQKIRIKIVYY